MDKISQWLQPIPFLAFKICGKLFFKMYITEIKISYSFIQLNSLRTTSPSLLHTFPWPHNIFHQGQGKVVWQRGVFWLFNCSLVIFNKKTATVSNLWLLLLSIEWQQIVTLKSELHIPLVFSRWECSHWVTRLDCFVLYGSPLGIWIM